MTRHPRSANQPCTLDPLLGVSRSARAGFDRLRDVPTTAGFEPALLRNDLCSQHVSEIRLRGSP